MDRESCSKSSNFVSKRDNQVYNISTTNENYMSEVAKIIRK